MNTTSLAVLMMTFIIGCSVVLGSSLGISVVFKDDIQKHRITLPWMK